MFGKSRKSGNDKFIMAAGRANGNLKAAGTPFNKKKPMKTTPNPVRGQSNKKSVQTFMKNEPTLGQVNTFKTSGTIK